MQEFGDDENDAWETKAGTETVPGKSSDALRAAHLYYMQDLTMDAIAYELHTSRSSVSRLLSHARASGLVEIASTPRSTCRAASSRRSSSITR